jgi:hypothetical protein
MKCLRSEVTQLNPHHVPPLEPNALSHGPTVTGSTIVAGGATVGRGNPRYTGNMPFVSVLANQSNFELNLS